MKFMDKLRFIFRNGSLAETDAFIETLIGLPKFGKPSREIHTLKVFRSLPSDSQPMLLVEIIEAEYFKMRIAAVSFDTVAYKFSLDEVELEIAKALKEWAANNSDWQNSAMGLPEYNSGWANGLPLGIARNVVAKVIRGCLDWPSFVCASKKREEAENYVEQLLR